MLITTVCNAGSPVTSQEHLQPSQTLEQVRACLDGKIDHHWRHSRSFLHPCLHENRQTIKNLQHWSLELLWHYTRTTEVWGWKKTKGLKQKILGGTLSFKTSLKGRHPEEESNLLCLQSWKFCYCVWLWFHGVYATVLPKEPLSPRHESLPVTQGNGNRINILHAE